MSHPLLLQYVIFKNLPFDQSGENATNDDLKFQCITCGVELRCRIDNLHQLRRSDWNPIIHTKECNTVQHSKAYDYRNSVICLNPLELPDGLSTREKLSLTIDSKQFLQQSLRFMELRTFAARQENSRLMEIQRN